jgi:hypothetical protein
MPILFVYIYMDDEQHPIYEHSKRQPPTRNNYKSFKGKK